MCRNLVNIVTYETVEVVTRVLKSTFREETPEGEVARISTLCSQMHAEGMNMRLLGHFRSHISPDSADQVHIEMRHLLLTEMVARVLKVS